MLFGKTPFDAKNYNDLKTLVKTKSGNNLKFPPNLPISSECKNILVHLLQFDPANRIEWDDFFNHKLFEIHSKKGNHINPLNNSILIRDNEDKV